MCSAVSPFFSEKIKKCHPLTAMSLTGRHFCMDGGLQDGGKIAAVGSERPFCRYFEPVLYKMCIPPEFVRRDNEGSINN